MQSSTISLIAIVAILVVVGLAAWFYSRRKRSRGLRARFGPEYDRAVTRMGDQSRAESELMKRKERVRHFKIVPLSPEDARRFADRWRLIQSQFVENPQMAASNADALVQEVMQARGYPVVDFEQCAANLSVDHASVVDNYRKAHEISEQSHAGSANTEELREALVSYRALFDDLLEVRKPAA